MNLEERIKKGMIFYETEHKSIENKEIEERLDKDCLLYTSPSPRD